MDLTFFFALLGGLLVLAFVANRLVRFTHVCADVTGSLMAAGVPIGPSASLGEAQIFFAVPRAGLSQYH